MGVQIPSTAVCAMFAACHDSCNGRFALEVVLRASFRHTDAPSGLPRVLSCLGRLSCRNTGSQLNGRHPRPVNAYLILLVQL